MERLDLVAEGNDNEGNDDGSEKAMKLETMSMKGMLRRNMM